MKACPPLVRPISAGLAVVTFGCLFSPVDTAAATVAPGPSLDLSEIVAGLSRNDQFKKANLFDFSVVRHYILKNSRMDAPAELTVRFSFQRGVGKTYEIVSAANATGMSRKILDRIVESEVEASRPASREEGHMVPENYDFELLGTDTLNGRKCYVLGLHPRKKSRFLIQGKAWVDADCFALLKVAGRPAANVSFWVGKPFITQEFQKYGDFWLSCHNRSVSDSFMLGKSELTIDYTQYELNTKTIQSVALRNARSQGSF
jgi:hypothetical protein